ncbi:MAG: PaaX family transcriptional regulator, partial [Actinomycetota bacterium]|nr:PaaX family transcriptional regulator [Actinomycetota bacterium]
RRREGGAASARSLLLTVLGEFVFPRHAPVWTSVLVGALAELGVEEKAARQALARTAAEGLLVSDRLGRRVCWSLTPAGSTLLEEGTQRIYGFMREQRRWDGRWLVLVVTVPEAQRQIRHRLRTRLTWAGLGSPAPGLWVVPDARKEAELAGIVTELGVESYAFSWVGTAGAVGDEQRVVASAWPLDEVERGYEDFKDRYATLAVRTAAEAFAAQVQLVQEWRRFPFVDPALPAELLDHDWPGPEAARTFHRQHDTWHPAAQAHWESLCEAASIRS